MQTPILVIDCNEDIEVADNATWRAEIQSQVLHFREHLQQERNFNSSDC